VLPASAQMQHRVSCKQTRPVSAGRTVQTLARRGYTWNDRVGDFVSFDKGLVFGAVADDPEVELYLRWVYVTDVVYEETKCLCSLGPHGYHQGVRGTAAAWGIARR
jgi:hypothetical protein